MANHKRCGTCEEHKPYDSFHKDKTKPDGLRTICKPCVSVYYIARYKTPQARVEIAEAKALLADRRARGVLLCGKCKYEFDADWVHNNHYCMRCMFYYSMQRVLGITPEQFNAMICAQDGRCANPGCSRQFEDGKGAASACVDHVHSSGKIRGILCSACNTALGLCRDNPEVLRGLAEFAAHSGPKLSVLGRMRLLTEAA